MTPALKAYIESWLVKADHDLMSAQRLLEIEPMILDNACFHCQQAIEKCLKPFLMFHGRDVERTHNVIFLLSECANFDPVFKEVDLMKSMHMLCRFVTRIPICFQALKKQRAIIN